MMEDFPYDEIDQSFRDKVSTIDKEGKRVWVYPQKPKGRFHNYRVLVASVCLLLLFGMPFLKLHGEPFMLFNVLERKFIIFGILFGPQDFFLLGLSMVTFMVFIILFTVVYGRLFCGWTCPQTIFMEMIFRKIEYAIEGDYMKQKALDKSNWDFNKIWRKTLKHIVFFAISFIIANTFLSYIIGKDELFRIINEPINANVGSLSALLIFTSIFYGVFAFFREQVCLVVCPYGRLQGVLLDKNSIVVAYDYKRGEKRERFRKNTERTGGDCIDCYQCVAVCPTGIDIRHGTQLECTNCTACVDACDHIMDKVGMDRGLIRYASENSIQKGEKLKFNFRVAAYSVILVLLASGLAFGLLTRNDTETTILRTPGMMYQENADGTVSNLYNYKVNNKTFNDKIIQFKVEGIDASIRVIGNANVAVIKESSTQGTMFIDIDPKKLDKRSTKIKIGVYSNGVLLEEVKTSFLAPAN
jgi:cytochrome c oxidase accessory protein FixG